MEQACEREFEDRRQLMGEVIEDIRATRSGFRAADNLIREELYDRARVRAEVMGTGMTTWMKTSYVSARYGWMLASIGGKGDTDGSVTNALVLHRPLKDQ